MPTTEISEYLAWCHKNPVLATAKLKLDEYLGTRDRYSVLASMIEILTDHLL